MKMATFHDQLKEIEYFLLQCAAELRCQIKENQQRRVESLQKNVDQRVETERKTDALRVRNLASQGQNPAQSHSDVNSNLGASLEKQDPETNSLRSGSGIEAFEGSKPTFFSSEILELQKLVVEESVEEANDDQTAEEFSPSTGPKSIHLESNLGGKSDNVVPPTQEASERCSSGADITEESRCASHSPENPESRSLTMEDEDREAWSPSTEKKNSEFKEGISNYSEFHLIDLDGNELRRWMRNCGKWEYDALDDILSIRNVEFHPLVVDGNESSTEFEFRVMIQPLVNAHKVFEKMFEKKMADFDDLVDILSTFGDDFNSIDSPSLFTFDSGGVLAFFNGSKLRSSAIEATIEGAILERIWQWHWDPGGLV